MKKVLLAVVFSTLVSTVSAQAEMHAHRVSNSESMGWLAQHVFTLASDSLEGRNTAQEGQKKAARYIVAELEAYGLKTIAKDSLGNASWYQEWAFAKRFGDKRKYEPYSENIIALLPATVASDEYLVISAHYDHLGMLNDSLHPGADDNGTGTAALLEMARLFSQDSLTPRKKNILFIFFSGEEKGLLGSKHYSENPVVPMENVVANLNIDMVGRADSVHARDSNYIYVIGSDRISKKLDGILKATNKKQKNPLELDYTYNDEDDPNRFYERSDHYYFAKKGVPVIFFFSGMHADYHSPRDTPDKINFGILYTRMQLVHQVASALLANEKPLK